MQFNYLVFLDCCRYGNIKLIEENINHIDDNMIESGFYMTCQLNNMKMMKYLTTIHKKYKQFKPIDIKPNELGRRYILLTVFNILVSYGICFYRRQRFYL